MINKKENLMDKITSLAKRRGFVFPGSEIYGGLANTWDYGPVGVELKNNIKQAWWKFFVKDREDVVGIDAAILMNSRVWESSGHVSGFNDALVDCKACKARIRADHLIEDALNMKAEGMTPEDMTKIIEENNIKCPVCGKKDWTDARKFGLMFKTYQGVTEYDSNIIYLRPETAQAMFVNFKNVLNSTHKKIPFGIAQIGKSFRNEITPGNFIFRTIEFEQMELEYFIKEENWQKQFEYWQNEMTKWLDYLGIKKENYSIREHDKDELSHYSRKTVDFEYNFPFGTKELYGLAYRTNFDLMSHQNSSGQNMEYFDTEDNKKYIPHVIEPTFGVDRSVLAVMVDAYCEEEAPTADGKTETRVVMKFNKKIAPVKVAILPLSKKENLSKKAKEIFDLLKTEFTCQYDESQSIGKRYRRQDEIGTPYCITVDFESLDDEAVTVRDRDTMEQERVGIGEVREYLREKLK
ncbi:MAG: glycine--tRNA ligase [Candidatus Pacebacteria bacterium]|nr:glycine--tRNA ligase [Candidatus Paceibacterota bacterium]